MPASTPSRRWFAPLTLLIGAVLAFVAGEAMVRMFVVRTPWDERFAGRVLLPKSWEQVRTRNADVLAHVPFDQSYFVSDPLLGWTLGPSRASADGLYFTSAEGIRSSRRGEVYADRPAMNRIAIIGDSFTFGLEVPFAATWGAELERTLGDGYTVLNFGVDGYGLDQAYLRYERDARPWRPRIAVLGFIDHDLYRSLSVYNFITFPEWGFPFSKPRFELRDGTLELLNTPLESPSDIIKYANVSELPFVEKDPAYEPREWERRAYHRSYLLRIARSRYVSSRLAAGSERDDLQERIDLNTELVRSFVRLAAADGSTPLVVLFPSRSSFQGEPMPATDGVLAALRKSSIGYIDLRACIGELGAERAFIPSRAHYSPEGNAAVARCLLPEIRARLH